ncbi:MAG TPA: acyl-CoA dehydrogenase family protein [Candidatus Limnocylindrales bacterium]|nr:acyl-CoA dehydrogenase family protein [Candidatus Limnocylindrales bacterium]
MSDRTVSKVALDDVDALVAALETIVQQATAAASRRTDGGKNIDDHQVHSERIAYVATEVAAARALAEYARAATDAGSADDTLIDQAALVAGEIAARFSGQIVAAGDDFDLPTGAFENAIGNDAMRARIRAFADEGRARSIGRKVGERRGANNAWLPEDDVVMVRDSVRSFAEKEVGPIAERIHRHDELVPESVISAMAGMGYFGMSAPEEYGGLGMGNLAMIVTTEELSRVSLAAAGSLITRPEILTKALLKGGTEEQKKKWLAPVSAGELMVGISVTEPNVGSDVASVSCKAERAEVGGRKGWLINGAKAWCTFAGRANVLALLARTNPDPKSGARGLSLFIVEKDSFDGHEFEMRQSTGGVLVGHADATPGYRGMHSYTLSFENYFVPEENLIGGEGGLNKGFYLQMNGFAAGRLQTGGRATGLAQAALETTANYTLDRKQFGSSLIDFQLTQYKLGRMAAYTQAARQITYKAARAMDKDESISLEPAMAKLLACDVAVWVSQEGQLLHGGWGYAEEYAISRLVVDAQVLPIFEGVKPILELKVIARQLLA